MARGDQAKRRARFRHVFELVSAGYDRPPLRFFRHSAARLVEVAGVSTGDRVLDVATGTGWAALAAADAVGPSGRVVGVDLSSRMIALAREKAGRRGLRNVNFRRGDAMRLPYASNTFDAVVCSCSIFFMPSMPAALREWRRVLRPGGRLAFSAFGKSAFEPMMRIYDDRLRAYGVELPPETGPKFADPAVSRRFLRAAGFRDVTSRVEEFGYWLPHQRSWWVVVWNTGCRGWFNRVAPPDRDRFRAEHLREIGALRTERGIRLRMRMILASGRKPERRGWSKRPGREARSSSS